jgi:hypothetical protein
MQMKPSRKRTMKRIFGILISTVSQHGDMLDLHKIGKDIYELLTGTGSHGYKQRVRSQTVESEPERNYTPSEVAAMLNVSYDAALRLMLKMKGIVDLGTPTRRYKRGKKKLRISGKNLLTFIRDKTRE